MPRISKKFALLLVLAMMATMFVGMGTASASSNNIALTVPTVNPNTTATLGTIQIQETTIGSIGATAQIVVTLPGGSHFVSSPTQAEVAQFIQVPAKNAAGQDNGLAPADLEIVDASSNTSTLVINVVGRTGPGAGQAGLFNLLFNGADSQVVIISGAPDYKVNILDTTSGVSSGDVINAHVAVGGTSAYALSAPTRTQGTSNLGVLRIVENTVGALDTAAGHNTISVTVPEGITINTATCTLAGGFVAGDITDGAGHNNVGAISTNTSGLSRATFFVEGASSGLPGIIDITLNATIDFNAQKGDIVATIGGNNTFITPTTVIVGKYGEIGISSSCENPTNIYAGRVDAKIGTLVMSENVAATLVQNRTLNLELPEGCRWVTVPTPVPTKSSLILGNGGILNGSSNRIASYTVQPGGMSSGVASTVEFRQGTVSVPADFPAGDLVITYSGTAGAVADDGSKVSTKVATIVAPITLTGATPSPTIIIGKQDQTDTTFDIVEAGVGAIAARYSSTQTQLWVEAPAGVYFADLPEISVTGDLKIDTVGVKLSTDDKAIIIPITTSSATTASTISFKNVKFTLDRTVPEGSMKLSATGSAVDQWVPAGLSEDYTAAAKGQVANVTTPAPDQQNKTATFVIGQSSFTLEGVEITMDVAPYIKDGRTFLPIAYVAQALGVDANNIIWDTASQTVTLMKGDKVLQLKVGSKTMLINGAAITLDAAPEINNSRTCLPVALVAKAFGQGIAWDAATQTVTIQ